MIKQKNKTILNRSLALGAAVMMAFGSGELMARDVPALKDANIRSFKAGLQSVSSKLGQIYANRAATVAGSAAKTDGSHSAGSAQIEANAGLQAEFNNLATNLKLVGASGMLAKLNDAKISSNPLALKSFADALAKLDDATIAKLNDAEVSDAVASLLVHRVSVADGRMSDADQVKFAEEVQTVSEPAAIKSLIGINASVLRNARALLPKASDSKSSINSQKSALANKLTKDGIALIDANIKDAQAELSASKDQSSKDAAQRRIDDLLTKRKLYTDAANALTRMSPEQFSAAGVFRHGDNADAKLVKEAIFDVSAREELVKRFMDNGVDRAQAQRDADYLLRECGVRA